MSLYVTRLDKLKAEIGEENLHAFLSSFKCSAEPAAEQFLKRSAIRHDSESISRTYLALGQDATGSDVIKGFFTLAIKCLSVEKEIVSEKTFKLMNVSDNIAQAYLLGQLAKADGVEKGFRREMIK